MAQLIVALDFPEKEALLDTACALKGIVPWCKVGLEAFILSGPSIVAQLADMGFDIIQTDWAGLLKAYLEARDALKDGDGGRGEGRRR